MVSKTRFKRVKKRLKHERQVADELHTQVVMLANQLNEVDILIHRAVFPGPTIDAWAQQVRDFLKDLLELRGIELAPPPVPNPPATIPVRVPDGEYEFLSTPGPVADYTL